MEGQEKKKSLLWDESLRQIKIYLEAVKALKATTKDEVSE